MNNPAGNLRRWALPLVTVFVIAIVYQLGPLIMAREPADTRIANGAGIEWGDCWFETDWYRPVHCGYQRTADGHYALSVVHVPYLGWDRKADPVLFLNGGPGSSAYLDDEDFSVWWSWIDGLALKRDWVIFEQRGTGLGKPSLDCPATIPLYRRMLEEGGRSTELMDRTMDAVGRCFEAANEAGVDFASLNTRANARDAMDLMALMSAAGRFADWNLYGASYGSRVALEIMRQGHPGVRAAVLDGVYPTQVNPQRMLPWLGDHSLERVIRWCQRDAECADRYPQLRRQLASVLKRLRTAPIEVDLQIEFPDPELVRVRVDDINFADALFAGLYWWELAVEAPRLVDEMRRGVHSELLDDFLRNYVLVLLDTGFSDLVNVAVECQDNAEVSDAEYARHNRYPTLHAVYEFYRPYDYCRLFQPRRLGPSFAEPVKSRLPTLLLSGELDPVTPPRWGRLAAEGLTKGHHFELESSGHGAVDNHACGAPLVRAFLDQPVLRPNPACLEVSLVPIN